MVLVEGLRPTLAGVVIGAIAAVSLSRVLGALIFGVTATDAPTYAVVALLLTGIGTLASFLPAYRATLVDPITTLRDE
jgi:ABC-type lipoprotein release transport system permease subunit